MGVEAWGGAKCTWPGCSEPSKVVLTEIVGGRQRVVTFCELHWKWHERAASMATLHRLPMRAALRWWGRQLPWDPRPRR